MLCTCPRSRPKLPTADQYTPSMKAWWITCVTSLLIQWYVCVFFLQTPLISRHWGEYGVWWWGPLSSADQRSRLHSSMCVPMCVCASVCVCVCVCLCVCRHVARGVGGGARPPPHPTPKMFDLGWRNVLILCYSPHKFFSFQLGL